MSDRIGATGTTATRPSVEDRIAIQDLIARYAWALDTGDVEGVVGCFTPNGEVLARFPGHGTRVPRKRPPELVIRPDPAIKKGRSGDT